MFEFIKMSENASFFLFNAFAHVTCARKVFKIIQFRAVIIPTQIVFMWPLKSSERSQLFCPKMNVYISCLIGNTRPKIYFLPRVINSICCKNCNYYVKVDTFTILHVGLSSLEEFSHLFWFKYLVILSFQTDIIFLS